MSTARTFRATPFGAPGIAPQSIGIPAAAYPGRVATNSDLIVAVDRQQTRLALPLNATDTTMTVLDPSIIAAYNLLSIDNEIVKTTGAPTGNIVPISRGFDGTAPALHLASATVSGMVDAYHHNGLAAEIKAIETALGPNLSLIPTGGPFVVSTQYAFPPQTPGGSLNVGTNSITLTPVPKGINGTNVDHYLYIDQGTGTAEAVKITGGTAVSGAASGQIFVTCANTHSGAWRIQTATAGIQEAIYSAGTAVQVVIPIGNHDIHAPIAVPQVNYQIAGAMGGSVLKVAADFPLTAKGVWVCTPTAGNAAALSGFTVSFIQPDSTNIATYTHWPPAFYMQNVARFMITDVYVTLAWDVVDMRGNAGGVIIRNLQASFFNIGINIDGALDSVYLDTVRFWPYFLTPNQNSVWNSTATITGVNCAKCDDLHLMDFFSQAYVSLYFYSSANGAVTAHADNVTLDSVGTIKFDVGFMNISNLAISMTTFDRIALTVNGGQLRINNLYVYSGANDGTSQPWISQTAGDLQITNSWLWSPLDHSTVVASGGNLTMTGNVFKKQTSIAYTRPVVAISGTCRLTFIGNRISDKGSGAGTFLSIPVEQYHEVRANSFLGWAGVYPATITDGVYELDKAAFYPMNVHSSSFRFLGTEQGIYFGGGSPNSVVTAPPGSLFLGSNGGANITLWVKESGTGNTGWVAK